MKRTLTLAALVLLASGSAAFAAAPDAVAQAAKKGRGGRVVAETDSRISGW